jgi:hypothetical protein
MELVHTLAAEVPGRRIATLAAGVLAAGIPLGIATARFGRIDHHVAEALVMVLLARWAIIALPAGVEVRARRRLAFEALGAALSAWALSVFTGSPLYVALVLPVLLAGVILAPLPRLAGSGGPGLLAGGGLGALLSVPAVAAHGRPLAFGFPSWLQPLLLGAAGAAICGAVLVGRRFAPGRRRALAVAAATAAVAFAGALAFAAGAAQAWAAIREWLFKADPWLATIEEFQPILRSPAGPAYGVDRFFGAAGFAAPLALPLAAVYLRRAARARAAAFLLLFVDLALLTLLQARFGRVFVPFLAAAEGLALAWLGSLLARRVRIAWALPLAACLALGLDPRVRASLGLEADGLPDAAVEAAFDLRARAPGPSPGVLAPWDLGDYFLVVADRPVVATGFGPYPDPAAYYEATKAFTVGEDELLPWLAARRVGWVIGGATNLLGRVRGPTALAPFVGRSVSARWLQEVRSAPLLLAGSGVPTAGVRAFAHLMPVFASTRTVGGIDGDLPVLWMYQVVRGARLSGRVAPGARVVLEIPITEHGRTHPWRTFTDAGPDGRFGLTVPLATDLASPALSTAPGRLLVGAGPPLPIAIPERAVRAGEEVAVPGAQEAPR